MNHTQESREKMSNSWSYEKHFPPEVKQKISESCSGNKNGFYGKTHTIETRIILSEIAQKRTGNRNPMFGKHQSEDARKKISENCSGFLGKHHSDKTRRRISEAQRGEKNYNWRGGVSFDPYCVKFNREFKERVRAFFGHRCVECGKTQKENGRLLDVHHVNYDKTMCCNDTKPTFVTLCRPHNVMANYNREQWEQHYITIINERYGGQCYLPKGVA